MIKFSLIYNRGGWPHLIVDVGGKGHLEKCSHFFLAFIRGFTFNRRHTDHSPPIGGLYVPNDTNAMKRIYTHILIRSVVHGILVALLTLPSSTLGFTLIDSVSQTTFCSSSGAASDIITNPNDHCWWGMPPNPPGPVVVRYRFTPAFDAAFPNTATHPNLNAQIKAQVTRAFETWERAGTTPRAGAANYARNGADTFGDIRSIALHEIGHVIGFHHPDFGAGTARNFCPAGAGFVSCPAAGGEVMGSFINPGNINHILSFDELDGYNFVYAGQTFDFQMVGPADTAEIDIDTRVAGANNWALATLCGNQRVPMSPLQGRQTVSGRVQFNTASANPVGFRTLGINWDYQCNSIETTEFRIRTRGTDNTALLARYDGPAAGSPYTFQNYSPTTPVGNFKDDILHTWRNPNMAIPVSGLIHVGIEMDVWDWTVVSAIALDSIGTPCTASLVSSHSWNNLFNEGAALMAGAAGGADDELNMGPQQPIRARGIMLRTSDAPINKLRRLAFADVTGLRLKLEDLNRPTLEKLIRAKRGEFIEQFQPQEIRGNGEFLIVFEGNQEDVPRKLLESGQYLILPRPQYEDRELMVFVESSSDDSVTGTFALIGSPPFANTPGAGLPRLEIAHVGTDKVMVCWPDPSTGFILQSTPQLNPPRWTPVDARIDIKDGKKCVTLPIDDKRHTFFRLVNHNPDTCFPLPGQGCLD